MFGAKDKRSEAPRWRTANVLGISVIDGLARWGIGLDVLTHGAAGVGFLSVSAGSCAAASAADVVLVEPDQLLADVLAALASQPVDAIKLGYLLDPSVVDAVADALVEARGAKPEPGAAPLVVDPVLFDQSGVELATALTGPVYVKRILGHATVLTPNATEASALVGFPVGDRASMKDACKALFDRGVEMPLVKAHLERHSVDIAYDGTGFVEFGADKVPWRASGSGCVHASAIAALLAAGVETLEAFERAKKLATEAVRTALVRSATLRVANPMASLYEKAGIDPHRIEMDDTSAKEE